MRGARAFVLTTLFAGAAVASCSSAASSDDNPCKDAPCADASLASDDAATDATSDASSPSADDASDASQLGVTLSPTSVSMLADASATVNVTITRAPGVVGPVDVTMDDLGTAFHATPLQIAAGETSGQIRIDALGVAPQGTRTAPVTAKLGALEATAPLGITVTGLPGELDGTFGLGGKIKAYTGGGDGVQDMVLQPDGKILVAAFSDAGGAVLRFLPDGSLDATFGTKGFTKTPHPATGIHLRADGKIVVGGSTNGYPKNNIGITRLLSTGAPDTTFGAGSDSGAPGTVFVTIGANISEVYGFAVDADEKILLAGDVTDYSSFTKCFLARLGADGAFDATFASGGVYTSDTSCEYLYAPIRFSNGAIYLEATRIVTGSEVGSVARFTSAGVLDTTFGANGYVTPPVSGYTYGLALLAGDAFLQGVQTSSISISRYAAGGALDNAFATGGTSTTASGSIADLAVQPDGKIAVGGSASGNFLVVRLTSGGALDTTFNGTGFRTTDFGGGNDSVAKVLVTPANAIVAGGQSNGHIALAKYLP